MSFWVMRPQKPKVFSDVHREEHGIVLPANVPLRVHASNGGYLYTLYSAPSGIWKYIDGFGTHAKVAWRQT